MRSILNAKVTPVQNQSQVHLYWTYPKI